MKRIICCPSQELKPSTFAIYTLASQLYQVSYPGLPSSDLSLKITFLQSFPVYSRVTPHHLKHFNHFKHRLPVFQLAMQRNIFEPHTDYVTKRDEVTRVEILHKKESNNLYRSHNIFIASVIHHL
jgi:hypothetical protein